MNEDIESISDEFRHINVTEARLQPLRLDKMFMRATEWRAASEASSSVIRTPSPPRNVTVYPLPLPLAPSHDYPTGHMSPLARLFGYMELVPNVLKWFERPGELAALCRVNRAFYEILQKKLYQHIWVRPCELTHGLLSDSSPKGKRTVKRK